MICPNCNNQTEEVVDVEIGETNMCVGCGAFTTVNPASGNLIWMLDGRVLEAAQDARTQFEIEMKRNPSGDWEKAAQRLPRIQEE